MSDSRAERGWEIGNTERDYPHLNPTKSKWTREARSAHARSPVHTSHSSLTASDTLNISHDATSLAGFAPYKGLRNLSLDSDNVAIGVKTDHADTFDRMPFDRDDVTSGQPNQKSDQLIQTQEVAKEVMSEAYRILKSQGDIRAHGGPTGANQGASFGAQYASSVASSGSTGNHKGRSMEGLNWSDEKQDDDGYNDPHPPSKRTKKSLSPDTSALLACPFFKLSPSKYRTHKCVGPGWEEARRLKNDHLLRNHLWDPSKREGITHEQAEKLKNSNKRGVSEWDMWMNMWTIIFPDVDRPSTPYYDNSGIDDFEVFRERELVSRLKVHIDVQIENAIRHLKENLIASLPGAIANFDKDIIEQYIQTRGSFQDSLPTHPPPERPVAQQQAGMFARDIYYPPHSDSQPFEPPTQSDIAQNRNTGRSNPQQQSHPPASGPKRFDSAGPPYYSYR